MTIWQYAVRHDQSGNLQDAPLKRIAVFKNDTLRIEPYSSRNARRRSRQAEPNPESRHGTLPW